MLKKTVFRLLALLTVSALVLAACTSPATPAPQATQAPQAKLAVGIVLPTKDEPRWIQDETRFREALVAAGYDVEILFSQGSSAKEKENVDPKKGKPTEQREQSRTSCKEAQRGNYR
jgi:putative multiple sugar transport system substrate-binding protein